MHIHLQVCATPTACTIRSHTHVRWPKHDKGMNSFNNILHQMKTHGRPWVISHSLYKGSHNTVYHTRHILFAINIPKLFILELSEFMNRNGYPKVYSSLCLTGVIQVQRTRHSTINSKKKICTRWESAQLVHHHTQEKESNVKIQENWRTHFVYSLLRFIQVKGESRKWQVAKKVWRGKL